MIDAIGKELFIRQQIKAQVKDTNNIWNGVVVVNTRPGVYTEGIEMATQDVPRFKETARSTDRTFHHAERFCKVIHIVLSSLGIVQH